MAITSVASGIASVTLIAADTTRAFVSVENTDSNVLYLMIGIGTASSTNFTVSLASGDYYEVPGVVCNQALTGIWSGDGSGAALITTI